jgi:hypothetical protein
MPDVPRITVPASRSQSEVDIRRGNHESYALYLELSDDVHYGPRRPRSSIEERKDPHSHEPQSCLDNLASCVACRGRGKKSLEWSEWVDGCELGPAVSARRKAVVDVNDSILGDDMIADNSEVQKAAHAVHIREFRLWPSFRLACHVSHSSTVACIAWHRDKHTYDTDMETGRSKVEPTQKRGSREMYESESMKSGVGSGIWIGGGRDEMS